MDEIIWTGDVTPEFEEFITKHDLSYTKPDEHGITEVYGEDLLWMTARPGETIRSDGWVIRGDLV